MLRGAGGAQVTVPGACGGGWAVRGAEKESGAVFPDGWETAPLWVGVWPG